MDSLITAAARALAAGDPLGALNRVALARRRACARASRHPMAQLGDLVRRRPSCEVRRAPSVRKERWPARGVSSPSAEIALVSRDLGWPAKALDAAGRRSRSDR